MEPISLTINDKDYTHTGDETESLADYIRESLHLTGTKIGCRTGECGACTVLLDGQPVNACLIPVASTEGQRVRTVEKLAETDIFQQLAQAMKETGGVQCGFCTPGIMVTLWAWLDNPSLFGDDVAHALKNNLCRCTGYQPIIEAVNQVIAKREE